MGDRFKLLRVAGISFAAIIFFAGCSDGTTTIRADDNAAQTEEVEQSEQAVEQPTQEDSDAEAEEEAPQVSSRETSLGSRDNPYEFGASVVLQDNGVDAWEVQLLSLDPDAEAVLLEENMFNDPAPDGFVFAMVGVKYTYLGEDRGTPAFDLDLAYVTAEGTTHKSSDVSVVTPNDVFEINELYQNGSALANEAIAIPADSLDTGTWRFSVFLGDEIYIDGAPND
jgi:hypothetical protein